MPGSPVQLPSVHPKACGHIFIPLTKEESEDQRSKPTCPQSHSLTAGELCLGSRTLPAASQDLPPQSRTACLPRRELSLRAGEWLCSS